MYHSVGQISPCSDADVSSGTDISPRISLRIDVFGLEFYQLKFGHIILGKLERIRLIVLLYTN